MLSKEEIEALSSCVGSAIGEFGASETSDLAIEAIRKLESGLTPLAPDVACNWCKMAADPNNTHVTACPFHNTQRG